MNLVRAKTDRALLQIAAKIVVLQLVAAERAAVGRVAEDVVLPVRFQLFEIDEHIAQVKARSILAGRLRAYDDLTKSVRLIKYALALVYVVGAQDLTGLERNRATDRGRVCAHACVGRSAFVAVDDDLVDENLAA